MEPTTKTSIKTVATCTWQITTAFYKPDSPPHDTMPTMVSGDDI
jgi:hypothetical protein